MLNADYENEESVFSIADIGVLRATGGLMPGDYIRKVVVPKLEKMGMIDHTPARKLVHWRVIVGKDEPFMIQFLTNWYKSPKHPYYWNDWYQAQSPADQKLWVAILNECLESGWCWPKVINDKLTFGSRYSQEEQPKYDDLDAMEQAWNDADFERED